MSFDAVQAVNRLLIAAVDRRASDLHVEPVADGYEARLRVDGLLQPIESFSPPDGRSIVLRLMVLAKLLTYRLDVPQEGRANWSDGAHDALPLRISVIPTARGLRAAVRLPAELSQPRSLDGLGLPAPLVGALDEYARGSAGMLIVCGPAGSGKTTAAYALLERIARLQPGSSLITIEDPVERQLAGVTQIEVAHHGEMTFDRALRSVVRQDPQVLLLGEVRDAESARIAVNAALSGHRLICTLHAADGAGAILRLIEMNIEPFRIAGSLWGVLNLRLVRRRTADGYAGRIPLAEMVRLDDGLREALMRGASVDAMRLAIAQQVGCGTLMDVARRFVETSVTDREEIERVLGPGCW
ncbi:MAG TPA: ATPase, T2SS/T4P/T4SS family [Tepidisphaeraceae bacterium]|nr:ATPase, T2SS/T4P/T4SS family [Tepidisphaeraceae bacterium]